MKYTDLLLGQVRVRRIALVISCFIFGAASAVSAETRVAFIVGNSAYENAPPLSNPVRDARLVGDTLVSLGFDVTRHQDLTRESFAKALGAFLKKSRDADVTFFYFAGHGMQYDGQNYLVGTDAELISELDIEGETIALDKVVELLERNSKAALIFVDACRDNPLATDFYRRNFSETRALNARGLARVRARIDGSMLVFAAGPGQVAYDGDGRNSPFATALATHLPTEGKEILTLTKRIIGDVRDATDGRQSPIVTNDLTKEIFLREAALRPLADVVAQEKLYEAEAKVFSAALRIGSFRSWAQYFDAYPNGAMRHDALKAEATMFRREVRYAVDYRLSNATPSTRLKAMRAEAPNVFGLNRTDAIAVQALLSVRGFDVGNIDGRLGPSTFASIAEFQESQDLTSDGILDRATLAALGIRPKSGTEASRYSVSSIWGKRHRREDLELVETDPRVLDLVQHFGTYPATFGFRDGHVYMAIHSGYGWYTFDAANRLAQRAGGHLATITSREENNFIFKMIKHDSRYWVTHEDWTSGPTIGLYQEQGSVEPAGGWVWITGEPPTYINWDRDMPNNNRGTASVAAFGHPNPRSAKHWVTQRRLGTWDDYNGIGPALVAEISD